MGEREERFIGVSGWELLGRYSARNRGRPTVLGTRYAKLEAHEDVHKALRSDRVTTRLGHWLTIEFSTEDRAPFEELLEELPQDARMGEPLFAGMVLLAKAD